MNKKIITIAEVVFALIFVILLALFMSTIITKGNSTNTQLIDTLETTGGTSLNSYDNATMKGESVISAIRNIKSIGNGNKLQVDVYLVLNNTANDGTSASGAKPSAGVGNCYGYLKATGSNAVAYKNPGSEHKNYINPTSDFVSHVLYNTNGIPVGIQFSQINNAGHECVNSASKFDYSSDSTASTAGITPVSTLGGCLLLNDGCQGADKPADAAHTAY